MGKKIFPLTFYRIYSGVPATLTRSKASGSSSRFQGRGGGVTGKEQDRDKTVARQGKDRGTKSLVYKKV